MNLLLSFVNPLEFILRYTVIVGTILAIIGVAVSIMSKRIVMAIRKTDEVDKTDKLYVGLALLGLALILIGMIIMALPIENTLYKIKM